MAYIKRWFDGPLRKQLEMLSGKRCRYCCMSLKERRSGLCAGAVCNEKAAIEQAFNGI